MISTALTCYYLDGGVPLTAKLFRWRTLYALWHWKVASYMIRPGQGIQTRRHPAGNMRLLRRLLRFIWDILALATVFVVLHAEEHTELHRQD